MNTERPNSRKIGAKALALEFFDSAISPTYPTLTGTKVIVSLPKMSITLTATV